MTASDAKPLPVQVALTARYADGAEVVIGAKGEDLLGPISVEAERDEDVDTFGERPTLIDRRTRVSFTARTLTARRNSPAGERRDPWRMEEWHALPEVCLIAACEGQEIDQRAPVFLRDGTMHKACVEHWEPIYRVLGEQATWEREDASREGAKP